MKESILKPLSRTTQCIQRAALVAGRWLLLCQSVLEAGPVNTALKETLTTLSRSASEEIFDLAAEVGSQLAILKVEGQREEIAMALWNACKECQSELFSLANHIQASPGLFGPRLKRHFEKFTTMHELLKMIEIVEASIERVRKIC